MKDFETFTLCLNLIYNFSKSTKWQVVNTEITGLPNYLIKGYSIGLSIHYRWLSYKSGNKIINFDY